MSIIRQTQIDKFENLINKIATKYHITTTEARKMLADRHKRVHYEACKECVRIHDEKLSESDPHDLAQWKQAILDFEAKDENENN